MITESPKQAGWIVHLFRVSSMSLVKVEPLHRSFSIAIRHPLFDVLVYVVFYIIADVGPFVLVYVGADVGIYVVVYVVPAHLPDGYAKRCLPWYQSTVGSNSPNAATPV
jgi:hypothetical protein